ncbi:MULTISPECIES: hypothetical protein [unclassified Mycolicibacterium]|uniref:hypothetical protein n=1 Tax=unclassified Mycolicibacterium TaxID=2636767 RepID=UPI0012DDEDD2|nr:MULTISPECIES: hypothetical protein [unclassified Mycolicibacterium]MUL84734.1 hypothetical protein [Mycolicibacterium sp. CBMA 329]MUL88509.1 hypothetical protein [Mycolicibacterium sp. CBMA 331]MUM00152.1 hypothetical protein [Mycolicibacterium sp. CBMA 334]MUM27816.1 hypothetical protein [Mycolicibacterium sp. CBMA 295]MUM40156.1 hypothetical protein [Mycolicibacterium sp. CBMA 247]
MTIEVDGSHHYSVDNKPSPDKYAENMSADRELKLNGGTRHVHLSRILAVSVACLLPATGCSGHSPTRSQSLCESFSGAWDQDRQVCTVTGTNAHYITVTVTAQYPDDLIDNPARGFTIKKFLGDYFAAFAHPDDQLVRDGSAQLAYTRFEHAPNTTSVVFTNSWYLGGAHPNDEITTFTFDLEHGKALQLADLFCGGVDPLVALPALIRPYVQQAVDDRIPIAKYEPGPDSWYADDYRAWYLDGPDLVLLMPSARIGPMHGGQWQPHIPLTQLQSLQRNCPA